MATGHPVHDEPPDVQHASVVVDVQKGDLVIILSQYEEKGVHELNELGEVVPPQDIYDLIIHFLCTVYVLAVEVVSTVPHSRNKLIEHVEGQEREAQIVEHQEASAGVRLPVFHVLGPHPHDQKVHDCECKGWWVVVEQQPSSHPLISGTHP